MSDKSKKILKRSLTAVAVLAAAALVAGLLYWNHMLNLLGNAEEQTVPTLSQEEEEALLGTVATVPEEETEPKETWPQVASDKNITNIMLVGQDARPGEPPQRSDSMILVTVNKSKKTITLTSFMRDQYVQIPGYGDNKLNATYVLGGMELLDLTLDLFYAPMQ